MFRIYLVWRRPKAYCIQTCGGKGILTMTREGITIQLKVADIRSIGRSTQGVRAINLAEDDRVASVERMIEGKLPAEEVVP